MAIAVAVAAIGGCSKETEKSPREFEVFAEVMNPIPGSLDQSKAMTADMKFEWTTQDKIDVFASEKGEQMIYSIREFDNSVKSCTFKVVNFNLLDATYYSMYPTQGAVDDFTAVPVTFDGQVQEANGTASHLGAYDYNVASEEIKDNSGCFSYSHLVTWLVCNLTVPSACTVRSVSFQTPSDKLVSMAKVNVKDGTMTSTDFTDKIELGLGGAGVTLGAGEVLKVYVTLAPFTVPGKLTVCATDADGQTYVASVSTSMTLQAGRYYTINKTLANAESSSLTGSTGAALEKK